MRIIIFDRTCFQHTRNHAWASFRRTNLTVHMNPASAKQKDDTKKERSEDARDKRVTMRENTTALFATLTWSHTHVK